MPRTNFDLTIGVEFTNSVADSEEVLDEEMKEVQSVVRSAIESRLSKTFRGSVRVWLTRASMEQS